MILENIDITVGMNKMITHITIISGKLPHPQKEHLESRIIFQYSAIIDTWEENTSNQGFAKVEIFTDTDEVKELMRDIYAYYKERNTEILMDEGNKISMSRTQVMRILAQTIKGGTY